MKNTKRLGLIALSILIVGTSAYASKGEPGSANDPLVTKSYIDSKLQELETKLKLELASNQANTKPDTKNMTFEVVTVPKGSTIVGEQGTEIIVRSGSGQIVSGAGGGLQDMTDGVDALAGTNAKKYHLMIVPRDDGRGINATTELIVMVRGGYTIQ